MHILATVKWDAAFIQKLLQLSKQCTVLSFWSFGRYAVSLLNLAFTHFSFFVTKMKFAELKLRLYLFKSCTKSARKIRVKTCDSEQLS